jgi:hypothetical protein
MTDGTSPISRRTSEQPFFPRFGDIVFSREPSVTSYAIRASYALPPLRSPTPVEASNSDNSFSHAAFVTDGNTIIHATKKGSVDLVSLRHFFATEGIEYAVLREPNNDKTDDYYRSTYYLGQDYDVGFVSRFLKRDPAAGKQVCSTLTANMLDQFGLAKIPEKDVISPKQLIVELRRCGWSDVTSDYENHLRIASPDHVKEIDAYVESYRDTVHFIHSQKKRQAVYSELADFLLEELLRIAQLAGAGAEIEEQSRREIANRPPKGAPQIFHDTDPFE